jgi:hypothetical protein
MKTKLLIVLFFGVLLGIGVFSLSKNANPSSVLLSVLPNRHRPTPSADIITAGELTTTASDIIGYGQDLACDWKIPLGASTSPFTAGKLWTSSGRGRSTTTAEMNGTSIEANVMYLKSTAYAWITTDGQKTGMKLDPSSIEEFNRSMTPQERQQAEQIRSSMLFTCHTWTPDETKFILPPDVTFEER